MKDLPGSQILNQVSHYYLIGLLGLSLWGAPLASLTMASGYQPQNPSSPNGPTGSTGTRGCPAASVMPLTALAPQSHVGKTVSTYPTFFWYGPDTNSSTIGFNLYAVNEAGESELLWQETLTAMPGLMHYTLPSTAPGLVAGRQYRWEVELLCYPDRPSSLLRADAYIEVVPSVSTRGAGQLAEAGIWYDALAVALATPSTPEWLELLGSLAQLEPATTDGQTLSQRDRLQLVIDHERS
ncbi:DUF928 domain-containing protein [Leptolyngbya sp. FACHB-8]|uniref:DUF928 domain-containing protein n=2 Tax=Leptolyngbya TaxID=47251 RepID=UPI0016865E73|nr:DUF928 domain-containing protein [Leptolyngbya sp. FACHB-8]